MPLKTTLHKKKFGNSSYWDFDSEVKRLLELDKYIHLEVEIKKKHSQGDLSWTAKK